MVGTMSTPFTIDDVIDILMISVTNQDQRIEAVKNMALTMMSKYHISKNEIEYAVIRRGIKLVLGPCILCQNVAVRDTIEGCGFCNMPIHSMCGVGGFCRDKCRTAYTMETMLIQTIRQVRETKS